MPGAALTEPAPVKPIPVHLGLPAEPPRVASARGPPLDGLEQIPSFDLTDRAPSVPRSSGPEFPSPPEPPAALEFLLVFDVPTRWASVPTRRL